jgi:hypothetical protein
VTMMFAILCLSHRGKATFISLWTGFWDWGASSSPLQLQQNEAEGSN